MGGDEEWRGDVEVAVLPVDAGVLSERQRVSGTFTPQFRGLEPNFNVQCLARHH